MTMLAPLAEDSPATAEPRAAGLFPHFVARLSGLPVDAVESLRAPRCEVLLARLHDLEDGLAAARERVSALLFAVVNAREDADARKQLVNLRRDLFNLRPGRPAGMDAARAVLPPAEHAEVEVFAGLLRERAEVLAELRSAHAEEMRAGRRRFRALLKEGDFQKGLLLSSPALHAAQGRYLEADPGAVRGRLEKTERGLLRYFTRTAMKATPFGTLCAVVPGTLMPADGPSAAARLELGGDPRAKRSFTRLNKQICGVVTRWLTTQRALRPRLEVELNPTLSDEPEELAYLAVHQGREVFQRIGKNAALDLVAAELAIRPHLPLAELARALAGRPEVEASEDQALQYVDKLVEAGFLRFRLGIREQDVDWDLPLCAVLESTGDERALRLAAMLRTLRERIAAYDAAGTDERVRLLAASRADLVAVRDGLKLRGANFATLLPFMEDSTADAPVALRRTGEMKALEDTLAGLVRLVRRVAAPRGEQAEMRHWFDAYYGSDAGDVPLLRYFEDFSREHLKPQSALHRRAAQGDLQAIMRGQRPGNAFGLPFVDALRAAERALVTLISTRWAADPGAEQVDLTRADLEAVLDGVPASNGDPASVAAFAELIPARGGAPPRLILTKSAFSLGYGKFFSRFLHLFPARVQRDLMEASAALSDGFVAEICGDGNHNANLHPPLLPWEISYPTGESGVAEEQIRCTEIVVGRHPDDPRALCLRHAPTGRRVVPVDLGFVNPGSRPPLHHLLSRFTPPVELYLRLPDYPGHMPGILLGGPGEPPADAAARMERAGRDQASREALERYHSAITLRPRLVYEGSIVLRRRQWVVPGHLLPQQAADETAADFFLRANRWRQENGIPRDVYLSLHRVPPPPVAPSAPASAGDGTDAGEAGKAVPEPRPAPRPVSRASLNDLKPQYVDFANPLLAGLFGHLGLADEPFIAVLAERSPGADEIPAFGGERYAAEQIIQLNLA